MSTYDTDDEPHPKIADLAESRFDGDIDRAYEWVIQTGLDHTPVKRSIGMNGFEGGRDDVYYTETNPATDPVLFFELDPDADSWLTGFGNLAVTRRPYDSFFERLQRVSEYRAVDHRQAAFTIDAQQGQWFGWGFAELVTALRETPARYRDVGLPLADRETVHVLFEVGQAVVHFQARHNPMRETLETTGINVLWKAVPIADIEAISAVLGKLNASLRSAEPPTRYRIERIPSLNHDIEPAAVIQIPGQPDKVGKVLVTLEDLAAARGHQEFAGMSQPTAVANLRSWVRMDRLDEVTIRLDSVTAIPLENAKNVSLFASAVDADQQR